MIVLSLGAQSSSGLPGSDGPEGVFVTGSVVSVDTAGKTFLLQPDLLLQQPGDTSGGTEDYLTLPTPPPPVTIRVTENTLITDSLGAPLTFEAIHADLRVGVRGFPNTDGSITAHGIVVFASSTDPSKIYVKGVITQIDAEHRIFRVNDRTIIANNETIYVWGDNMVHPMVVLGFSDLRVGMYVEVEGHAAPSPLGVVPGVIAEKVALWSVVPMIIEGKIIGLDDTSQGFIVLDGPRRVLVNSETQYYWLPDGPVILVIPEYRDLRLGMHVRIEAHAAPNSMPVADRVGLGAVDDGHQLIHLIGPINNVNQELQQFTIFDKRVQATTATVYYSIPDVPTFAPLGFYSLHDGAYIALDAVASWQSGTTLAEMQHQGLLIAARIGIYLEPPEITIRGEIEKIDAEHRVISVQRTPIKVTENTVIEHEFLDAIFTFEDLKVGQCVEVTAKPDSTNTIALTALHILIRRDPPPPGEDVRFRGEILGIDREHHVLAVLPAPMFADGSAPSPDGSNEELLVPPVLPSADDDPLNSVLPELEVVHVKITTDTIIRKIVDGVPQPATFGDFRLGQRVEVIGHAVPDRPIIIGRVVTILPPPPPVPIEIDGFIRRLNPTSHTLLLEPFFYPRPGGDDSNVTGVQPEWGNDSATSGTDVYPPRPLVLVVVTTNTLIHVRGTTETLTFDALELNQFVKVKGHTPSVAPRPVVIAERIVIFGEVPPLPFFFHGVIREVLPEERAILVGPDYGPMDANITQERTDPSIAETLLKIYVTSETVIFIAYENREGTFEDLHFGQMVDVGGAIVDRRFIARHIAANILPPPPPFEYRGLIRSISPDTHTIRVDWFLIRVTLETEISHGGVTGLGFDALAVGQTVEVRGDRLLDGSIRATIIHIVIAVPPPDPQLIAVAGRISEIHPDVHAIVVGGVTGRVTPDSVLTDLRLQPITFEQLRVGMEVAFTGLKDPMHEWVNILNLVAALGEDPVDLIKFSGRIASINADSHRLVVGDRDVVVESDTIILDPRFHPIGFGDLAVGQMVEVAGRLSATGEVVARHIQVLDPNIAPDPTLRIIGPIERIGKLDHTIQVKGMVIFIRDTTELLRSDGTHFAFDDLAVGDYVAVVLDDMLMSPINVAKRVVLLDEDQPPPPPDEVRLWGLLTRLDLPILELNHHTDVSLIPATVLRGLDNEAITPLDLAVGNFLRVKASRSDGSLDALVVRITGGLISDVDSATSSIIVADTTVLVSETTEIELPGGGEGSFSDLEIGKVVLLRGDFVSTDTLAATRIRVLAEPHALGDIAGFTNARHRRHDGHPVLGSDNNINTFGSLELPAEPMRIQPGQLYLVQARIST
ncbi:MAG: DUF5666 domain-containing protein, partial [bacterium]